MQSNQGSAQLGNSGILAGQVSQSHLSDSNEGINWVHKMNTVALSTPKNDIDASFGIAVHGSRIKND